MGKRERKTIVMVNMVVKLRREVNCSFIMFWSNQVTKSKNQSLGKLKKNKKRKTRKLVNLKVNTHDHQPNRCFGVGRTRKVS